MKGREKEGKREKTCMKEKIREEEEEGKWERDHLNESVQGAVDVIG